MTTPRIENQQVGETGMPTPPRHHRLASFCARWAGRRDGRRRVEADDAGHRPYTRRIEARVRRGEAALDGWLHDQVAPIDRFAAELAEQIASLKRASAQAKTDSEETSSSLEAASVTLKVNLARRQARLGAEQAARVERTAQAARELAGVPHMRRHILDTARGGAAAFEADYEDLVSSYLDGYRRRCKTGTLTRPVYASALPWVDGDLPLLVVVIDPDASQLLTLSAQGFWEADKPLPPDRGH